MVGCQHHQGHQIHHIAGYSRQGRAIKAKAQLEDQKRVDGASGRKEHSTSYHHICCGALRDMKTSQMKARESIESRAELTARMHSIPCQTLPVKLSTNPSVPYWLGADTNHVHMRYLCQQVPVDAQHHPM